MILGVEWLGVEARGEGESQAVRLEHLDFLLRAVTVLSEVICSKQSKYVYIYI